ncbi:MAG TPA: hypothetical protein VLT90_02845 [Terriglobales bacterium]|nr:hypothetical protein [Terriglobales bacterium]
MSIRSGFVLVVVLAGTQSLVLAQGAPTQNPGAGNPPAQTGEGQRPTPPTALSGIMGVDTEIPQEDTSSRLPQLPMIVGGRGPSLVFRAEQERSNYVRGGINVGGTYDDNASMSSTGALTNTTYSVFPNITVEQTFSRMRWDLAYAGGLTVNQRFTNRNQGSHSLSFDSQFRLSPHVNLRVGENFSLTTGFFDSGNLAAIGGYGPNASLIAPLSKQRSSSTVASADYHFALNDIAGASGSFDDLHFSDEEPTSLLADSRSASGSAFWFHGFGRDWIGVSYRFQHLTFDPGNGISNVHSVLVVNTITLPSRFTLSAFAGPEYSDNRAQTVGAESATSFAEWSPSGGIELSWQGDHTAVSGGFSRQISGGGGVLGVVRLQDVHAGIRQELYRGWAMGVSGGYGNNKALTVPTTSAASSIDTATVSASLEHNLGRSFTLRLGYAHAFQDQSATANPAFAGGAHANRYFVTLGYQWERPLGR